MERSDSSSDSISSRLKRRLRELGPRRRWLEFQPCKITHQHPPLPAAELSCHPAWVYASVRRSMSVISESRSSSILAAQAHFVERLLWISSSKSWDQWRRR